jgi:protein-tyrosine phosphatase
VHGFVDIHSHVVPSGDDGVFSVEEGLDLIASAAQHGTTRIYGTPHVWPIDGLSEGRDQNVRDAFAEMKPVVQEFGVDLQLGFEVTPAEARFPDDLTRYRLGGLDAILIEVPFSRDADVTLDLGVLAEASGLTPIIAHPERSYAMLSDDSMVTAMKQRGWLVQVNGSSLLGSHGRPEAELAWSLIERGLVDLVASDGHRATRPPHLDGAYNVARSKMGAAADALFDGSALDQLAPALAGSDSVDLT